MRGPSDEGRSRLWAKVFLAALIVASLLAGLTALAASGSRSARASSAQKLPAASGRPTAGQDIGVLAATITPDATLLHDGDGVATVALADVTSTDLPLRGVRTTLRVPAPARVGGLGRLSGWRCTVSGRGHLVSCAPTAAVTSSGALAPINLNVRAVGTLGTPSFGRAALRMRATWTQRGESGRPLQRSSSARLVVTERAPLAVQLRSVEHTVIAPIKGVPTTPAILVGTVGRRTPEPISFAWRQLCGRGACARVRWTSATRGLLADGQQPSAAFTAPRVNRPQTLRFALTASDPRGPVTARVSVRVEPDQVKRLNPALRSMRLAGTTLRANQLPVTGLRLKKADRAIVTVGAPGATTTRVNRLVVLDARVGGQRVARVGWTVSMGPRSMLAGARRTRTAIKFRAPAVPGTYAVRMSATTAAGRFTRDELIEVNPAVRASADVASAGSGAERVFCDLLAKARKDGSFSIPLPSGGTFSAATDKGPASPCSPSETLEFRGGRTTLGSFELTGVQGEITRQRGLVITGGSVEAPSFWSAPVESAADQHVRVVHRALAPHAAGDGLKIGFLVPREGDISVGLGIPLTSAGFDDLAGEVKVGETALSKFPLTRSLPAGWKMSSIRLSVVPEARRFELTATAAGPKTTDGELSFFGVLTFDGQVSVSLAASNLAVFQSAGGQQAALTAAGTLTLLPGQRIDSANPNGNGSVFPVIDVSLTGKITNYRPADNLTLSGEVTWSSNGSLDLEGELVTAVKGTQITATVSGSYTDANDWKVFASLETGPEGLPIGTGPLLKLKTVRGELTRTPGRFDVSLKGEAKDIHLAPGVNVKSATVEFTTACNFPGQQTAAGPGTFACLLIDSTFELKVLPDKPPLTVTGKVKLDLGTLKFETEGGVNAGAGFGPQAFRLHDVKLFVANTRPAAANCAGGAGTASASGLFFGFTAKAQVLGLPLNVNGAYLGGTDAHYCLGATVGAASLPTGNGDTLEAATAPGTPSCSSPSDPTLQGLQFRYSSDTQVADFSGKFCLPSSVRQKLGTIGTGVGSVDLKLSTDGFEGKASYKLNSVTTPAGCRPHWFINARNDTTPDPTRAALGFCRMSLSVTATKSAGLNLGIDANGEVSMPAPTAASGGSGQPSTAPVGLGVDISLRPIPQLTFTANVGENVANQPCSEGTAKIKSAFGAQGFNICQFGLQGTIGASGVGLAVNAKFTPPTSWGPQLGVKNASFEIGFNISAQNPCVDLSILRATPGGGPALDLMNKGAIKANEAILRIAPNGCRLPGRAEVPAGIRLAFDGALFGTPTHLDLKLERQAAGLKIDAALQIGKARLGPLEFGLTSIRVLLDPQNKQTTLSLKTSVAISHAIGSGKFDIDGTFNSTAGNTSLDATTSLHAQVLKARLDGNLSLHYQSGTAPTKAKFSGGLDIDLLIMKLSVKLNTFEYDGANGGLQALDIEVNREFRLGPVEGHIGGGVTYSRGNQEIGLKLSGRVKVWTFETSFHLAPKLSTNIKLPFDFGPGGETTRISKPGTLLVLRLKGKLDGHVESNGGIQVDKVMKIQGCFPFETLCVDIGDAKVDTANGTVTFKVFGYDVVIDASQYVKSAPGQVDYSPGVSYVINENSGKCADVPFADFRDGKSLQQVDCKKTRHIAQEFKLLSDGTLRVRNQDGREFCVSGENRQVKLGGCDPFHRADEIWYRDEQGRIRGYDHRTLKNGAVDLCLEVPGASKTNDTLLALADCTGATNQRWVIVDLIRQPARVGCLDVPQGNLTSELKVFPVCNHSENQAFALYPNGELKVRGQCVAAAIRTGATLRLEGCTGAPTPQQRWVFVLGHLCVGNEAPSALRMSEGARCIVARDKQGDYFPVDLQPFNRRDSNQRWDVTY